MRWDQHGYYGATAVDTPDPRPLDGDLRTDAVVIGGGLTGAAAALALSEAGIATVMLDAHRPGWGASGRSGGQVIPGFAADMTRIERWFGTDAARDLWNWSVQAVDAVRENITRYRIDCDWTPGHLVAAARRPHAEELQRYAGHMRERYGAPVEFLDAASGAVAGGAYHGYYRDAGAGHLHPLNYTLGMIEAARAAGVAVYAPARVSEIHTGSVTEVRTDRGNLRCEHVLVCVNAWAGELDPALDRWQMPVASHIVATEPLADEVAAALIPERAAVEDTRRLLNYFRVSGDNRLLFGGRVGLTRPSIEDCYRVLGRRIRTLFPHLGAVRTEYAWGGEVAITSSLMPRVARRGPVCFAHGFCGHGMALSGLAGRILAESISGADDRLSLLSRAPNRALRLPRPLRSPALALALAWYRLRDAL